MGRVRWGGEGELAPVKMIPCVLLASCLDLCLGFVSIGLFWGLTTQIHILYEGGEGGRGGGGG